MRKKIATVTVSYIAEIQLTKVYDDVDNLVDISKFTPKQVLNKLKNGKWNIDPFDYIEESDINIKIMSIK